MSRRGARTSKLRSKRETDPTLAIRTSRSRPSTRNWKISNLSPLITSHKQPLHSRQNSKNSLSKGNSFTPHSLRQMNELDSFFARKDKKKGPRGPEGARTPGAKYTPNSLAKRLLEETDGTPTSAEGRRKDRGKFADSDEDEEWKPSFEEEKKDYSGLKIQPLILPEADDEAADVKTDDTGGKSHANGPWKIADIQNCDDETQAPPSGSLGTYVNPIERRKPETTLPTARSLAPDMKSTIVFPSLYEAEKCAAGLRVNQSVWNRAPHTPSSEPRSPTGNFRTRSEIGTPGRRDRGPPASSEIKINPWRPTSGRNDRGGKLNEGGKAAENAPGPWRSKPNSRQEGVARTGKYLPPNMRQKFPGATCGGGTVFN